MYSMNVQDPAAGCFKILHGDPRIIHHALPRIMEDPVHIVNAAPRRNWLAVPLLALVFAMACSDSTSPPRTPGGDGGGTSVSIPFCAGTEPSWLAFQDGEGAWTRAEPTSTGARITYQHTFNSDHAGVATARVFAHGVSAVTVQYGAPVELAIIGDTNPLQCGGPVPFALLGSVAGLDTNEEAQISAGLELRTTAPHGADNTFALIGLNPGPQEVLAARVTRIDPSTVVVSRLILRRVGDLPDSTTLPVFDFNSAESFAPAIGDVTVAGMGPEGAIVNTLLHTAHSISVVSFGVNDMQTATRSYRALPESQLATGDLQILSAQSGPVPSSDLRSAVLFFRSPVQQTLTLGPVVTPPTFSTVATTPALRLRAHFVPQAAYDQLTTISFQQGVTTVMTVGMTAAYASITGAGYDLVIPDLSTAAGFDPAWALHAGTAVSWSVSRTGGTLGLGSDAVPVDGSVQRNASVFGALPD
jgi:hypothetical protein